MPFLSIPHHYRFLAILSEATISRNVIQREAGSYSATARTCGSFPALLEGRLLAQHSVLHLTAYDILVQHFLLTRRPPASSLHRWRCRKCRVVGGSPPEKKRKLLPALRLAIGLLAPQLKSPTRSPTEIWELEYGVFAPFCGLS